jgi:AcrR family transcriptional regulator
MLKPMRALPGRESRSPVATPAVSSRGSVKQEQRKRILLATGELVAKRGYETVTIALIVKRARVSYKTFYNHFANKEECFLELFDRTVEQIRGTIDDRLDESGDADWAEQVAIAIRTLFETFLSEPLIARAIVVEAPTVGPVILKRYQEAMNMLAPLLRRGRESGAEAAALPPTLEVTLAGGVIWSAYQRLIVGEVDRIATLLPESVEFVLRPYLGREEAARRAAEIARAEPVA